MKHKLSLFFLLIFSFSYGQDLVRLPVQGSQVRVVNLKENGLILLDKSSNDILQISKLDTNLQVVWETQTQIPSKADFIDEYFDGKFLYIVLEPKGSRSFVILKISSSFAAYQKFDFPVTKGFQYGFFSANDRIMCIGGASSSNAIIAVLEMLPGASPKFINSSGKGNTELQSLQVKESGLSAVFILTTKRKSQIIYREYDLHGKPISSTTLDPTDDQVFLSAKYFEVQEQHLVVGNYGMGQTPSNGIHPSQGIFVSNLDHKKTIYYDFSEFDNLLDFLGERQKERLERQVKKKKDKGKEYKFDFRLYITNLISQNNQTLLVGEMFQPEFRSRGYSGLYDPLYSSLYWGRPILSNYYLLNNPFYGYNYRNSQVFDGFKYYEGIIFALDSNGKLSWDYSFNYKNTKYYDLASHLKVSNNQEKTIAMYKYGTKLKIAEINNLGTITSEREFDSQSLDLISRNKKTEFANFEYWYDKVYFNWGVQRQDGGSICFIQKIKP